MLKKAVIFTGQLILAIIGVGIMASLEMTDEQLLKAADAAGFWVGVSGLAGWMAYIGNLIKIFIYIAPVAALAGGLIGVCWWALSRVQRSHTAQNSADNRE